MVFMLSLQVMEGVNKVVSLIGDALMIQAPKVQFIHVFLDQFGPPVDVQGLGYCLIILKTKFNQDWEKTLHNQGFNCIFDDWDGYPAVFIPIKPRLEAMH